MSVESPEFTPSIDNTTPTEGLGIVDELYNVAQDLRAGEVNNLVDSAKAIYEEVASSVWASSGSCSTSIPSRPG